MIRWTWFDFLAGSAAPSVAWVWAWILAAFFVTGWAYYPSYSVSRPFCTGSSRRKKTYVGLVPLPERSGIDLDDGTLDKGVRSDKLIVRSVVNLEDGWSRFSSDRRWN